MKINKKIIFLTIASCILASIIILQNELAFIQVKKICKNQAGMTVYRSIDIKSIEWNTDKYFEYGGEGRYVLRPEDGSGIYILKSKDEKFFVRISTGNYNKYVFPQILYKRWEVFDRVYEQKMIKITQYGFNGNLLNYYFNIPTFPLVSKHYYNNSNMCGPPFEYYDTHNEIKQNKKFKPGRYMKLKFGVNHA